MNKKTWKRRVTEACKSAGTYKPYFEPVIETLADILEKRDEAQEVFETSGGSVVVRHTNKAGATNVEQNPVLRLINDLNRDALAYWRDLGLTPAGLRKLNEKAFEKKKVSALAEALKEIGG